MMTIINKKLVASMQLVTLISIIFFFISCSSDDSSESSLTNQLIVDGEVYPIVNTRYFYSIDIGSNLFDNRIAFITGNRENAPSSNLNGQVISFQVDFQSANENSLEEGTYRFRPTTTEPLTFVLAEIFVENAAGNSLNNLFAEEGTITVTGSGDNQVVIFDLIDNSSDRIEIKGRFKGELIVE